MDSSLYVFENIWAVKPFAVFPRFPSRAIINFERVGSEGQGRLGRTKMDQSCVNTSLSPAPKMLTPLASGKIEGGTRPDSEHSWQAY